MLSLSPGLVKTVYCTILTDWSPLQFYLSEWSNLVNHCLLYKITSFDRQNLKLMTKLDICRYFMLAPPFQIHFCTYKVKTVGVLMIVDRGKMNNFFCKTFKQRNNMNWRALGTFFASNNVEFWDFRILSLLRKPEPISSTSYKQLFPQFSFAKKYEHKLLVEKSYA